MKEETPNLSIEDLLVSMIEKMEAELYLKLGVSRDFLNGTGHTLSGQGMLLELNNDARELIQNIKSGTPMLEGK